MDEHQSETTINLQDLFSLLWKNVLLIAAITIALTVVVGLYTNYGVTKKYSSDTTLRVTAVQNGESVNLGDLQTSQKLVKTYSVIATSRKVLTQVIGDLDLDLTYGQLKDNIEVTSVQDTDIISIKVTLSDPDLASTVANKVASVFMNEVRNQVKINTLSLLDEAIPNESPVSPNLKLNIVIGFVLGLMISVGLVILKEFLDRTIKNENDVEKYLNAPVLGIVPELDKQYIK
ncbi:hypothetical protein KHQ81_09800 [Mycoplasmatota bacterium]|nr:hypothetical protein KHQ81_09800 [Mycoplasmatota bacterium]